MALREREDHKLPTDDYEGIETILDFTKVCVERYIKIGRPLAEWTQTMILNGYWHCANKVITCPLDKNEEKTEAKLDFATEVNITHPFDCHAPIHVTISGRKTQIVDLVSQFTDAGMVFPSLEKEEWEVSDFKKKTKTTPSTPQKRKTSGAEPGTDLVDSGAKPAGGSASSGSNGPPPSLTQSLSNSLQDRLHAAKKAKAKPKAQK